MYLLINKCVTAVILSNFSHHYLRNRSTSDTGILGYSVYFNVRNTLPKSGTFPPGHPVYLMCSWCEFESWNQILVHPRQWAVPRIVFIYRDITAVSTTPSNPVYHLLILKLEERFHVPSVLPINRYYQYFDEQSEATRFSKRMWLTAFGNRNAEESVYSDNERLDITA